MMGGYNPTDPCAQPGPPPRPDEAPGIGGPPAVGSGSNGRANRHKHHVRKENPEFEQFVRRVLRAYARRVGDGDLTALADLLLALRVFAGISQRELAEATGIDVNTISKYERDVYPMPARDLERIARYYTARKDRP